MKRDERGSGPGRSQGCQSGKWGACGLLGVPSNREVGRTRRPKKQCSGNLDRDGCRAHPHPQAQSSGCARIPPSPYSLPSAVPLAASSAGQRLGAAGRGMRVSGPSAALQCHLPPPINFSTADLSSWIPDWPEILPLPPPVTCLPVWEDGGSCREDGAGAGAEGGSRRS